MFKHLLCHNETLRLANCPSWVKLDKIHIQMYRFYSVPVHSLCMYHKTHTHTHTHTHTRINTHSNSTPCYKTDFTNDHTGITEVTSSFLSPVTTTTYWLRTEYSAEWSNLHCEWTIHINGPSAALPVTNNNHKLHINIQYLSFPPSVFQHFYQITRRDSYPHHTHTHTPARTPARCPVPWQSEGLRMPS